MAQVIIRNLDERVVTHWKREAAREKKSLEQKLRQALSDPVDRDDEEFLRLSERTRSATRAAGLDVDEIIREGRERCPPLP